MCQKNRSFDKKNVTGDKKCDSLNRIINTIIRQKIIDFLVVKFLYDNVDFISIL